MYNKVILVGNLTRNIEVRHSQAGLAIANTAIATSRKFKDQSGEQKEEVCFTDITFFGRSAEVAKQYLHKGSKILVEGRLVFDQWVDQNGQKRSKHSVAVETMQMLDSKGPQKVDEPSSDDTYARSPNDPTYSPKTYEAKQDKPQPYVPKPEQAPEPIDFDDGDIPF
jgi:single-strand DNA-binding protein